MTLDMVDTVWSAMRKDEFYSPGDLANTLERPAEAIVRVLEFLARYGFAHRVTKRELIFTKVVNAPSPGEALRILGTLVGDASAEAGQWLAFRRLLDAPASPSDLTMKLAISTRLGSCRLGLSRASRNVGLRLRFPSPILLLRH